MARRSSSSSQQQQQHQINNELIDEADSPVDGLENGKFIIPANNHNISDIWRRESHRPLPADGSTVLRFEIPFARVMPPTEKETSTLKKYVVYDLSVRQDSTTMDACPATIERRYTHFLQLYEQLRRDHSQLMSSVSFPKKAFMGNFSSDLIAERSQQFEQFLDFIVANATLRESKHFLHFLQSLELSKACQLLDERRNEQAVPILENSFRLLNKVFTDRSKSVLLLLCRLVAACTTSPIPHTSAERWCDLALRRYESVSDADLLVLYIPLLQTCVQLWWQRGRDQTFLLDRLKGLEMKGMTVKNCKTLTQAIHALDPRAETN